MFHKQHERQLAWEHLLASSRQHRQQVRDPLLLPLTIKA